MNKNVSSSPRSSIGGKDLPIEPLARKVAGPSVMSFPEAIQRVIEGHKITKLEWMDINVYGVLKDGLLMIRRFDTFHTWIITDGDLLGKDWVVL